jgi:hypothetical protein
MTEMDMRAGIIDRDELGIGSQTILTGSGTL